MQAYCYLIENKDSNHYLNYFIVFATNWTCLRNPVTQDLSSLSSLLQN